MDEHQENEIVDGLRRGDSRAWQRLYDAHAEAVWRLIARAMPRDSSEVTDVFQECILAAARSARSFDPARGTLWSWLVGIARHQVALYYRQRGRDRMETNTHAADGGISDDADDPAQVVEKRDLHRHVRWTLTDLPADYEVLLVAKYLDGLTVQQIASRESSTEQGVRSKLARARRAFRAAFQKRFPQYSATESP
jgi:RNA polymerase sigma-70 factor (ECF subfamily)